MKRINQEENVKLEMNSLWTDEACLLVNIKMEEAT